MHRRGLMKPHRAGRCAARTGRAGGAAARGCSPSPPPPPPGRGRPGREARLGQLRGRGGPGPGRRLLGSPPARSPGPGAGLLQTAPPAAGRGCRARLGRGTGARLPSGLQGAGPSRGLTHTLGRTQSWIVAKALPCGLWKAISRATPQRGSAGLPKSHARAPPSLSIEELQSSLPDFVCFWF